MNDSLINLDGYVFKKSQFVLLTCIKHMKEGHGFSLYLKDMSIGIAFQYSTFKEAVEKHCDFVVILEKAFNKVESSSHDKIEHVLCDNQYSLEDYELVQNF